MQNMGPVNYYTPQAAYYPPVQNQNIPAQNPYAQNSYMQSPYIQSPQPNYGYCSPSLDAMAVQNSILTKAHPKINQKVPVEIFGQVTTMLGGKVYNKADGSPFSGIVASDIPGAQIEETLLEGQMVRSEIFENGRLKSTTEYDQSGEEKYTSYYKPDGSGDFMSYREKPLGELKFIELDPSKKK